MSEKHRAPVSSGVDEALVGFTKRIVTDLLEKTEKLPLEVDESVRARISQSALAALAQPASADVAAVIAVAQRVGAAKVVAPFGGTELLDLAGAASASALAASAAGDIAFATVFGAAYAVLAAEELEEDGFIAAVAVGLELELRLGRALRFGMSDDTWEPYAAAGAIGAALAISSLRGESVERTVEIIGLAASESLMCRTQQRSSHATQSMIVARAASNGVIAADLVSEGLGASHRVLEAPRGFLGVLTIDPNYAELDNIDWLLVDGTTARSESDAIAVAVGKIGDGSNLIALSRVIADSIGENEAVASEVTTASNGVAKALGEFVASFQLADIPLDAKENAARTIANVLSLAAGATDHEVVLPAIAVGQQAAATNGTAVFGTDVALSAPWAALANGMAMHVEDFDDTHLQTVVHPGAPVVAAAIAMCQLISGTGADLLAGVAAGTEVAIRVGQGLGPTHFDRGWHLTGTAGHVGAAAAAARVARLSAEETTRCLELGALGAAGLQEALGTMTKAFHAGKAAMDGVASALTVSAGGFSGSTTSILDDLFVLSADDANPELALLNLGTSWELKDNAYKPYACGIVSHPVIDAAIEVRKLGIHGKDIDEVVVRINPVVLDVMGVLDPKDGLQSKFSFTHCFAVGLRAGAAGPAQYSDAIATDPAVSDLRKKVRAITDPTIAKDECFATITIAGKEQEVHIEHATGSAANPMTNEQLRAKAHLVADRTLGEAKIDQLFDVIFSLEEMPDISSVISAITLA